VLAVLATVFAARLAARFVSAPILVMLSGAPKSVAPALAVGLMPSGALSVTLGLAFQSRFPGVAGDTVLALSVGLAIAGEVVGPSALRRALGRAGELTPVRNGADAEVPPEHAIPEGTR
jgi:uncharacterized protein (DUF2062 family)